MKFLDETWRFGPLVIVDPGAVVVGLLISGMGLIVVAIGGAEIRRGRASRSWPTAKARVLSSGVQVNRHVERATTYAPAILYEYEVDGKAYQGRRVSAGEIEFWFENEAIRFAERFPEGAEVTIHYAPAKPHVAVLVPGLVTWARTALRLAGGTFVAFLGLPFVVIGFLEGEGSARAARTTDGGFRLLESGPLGYLAFGLLLVGSAMLFSWESTRKDQIPWWLTLSVLVALVGIGVALIQLGSSSPFPSRDAIILAGLGLLEFLGFSLRQVGESLTGNNRT